MKNVRVHMITLTALLSLSLVLVGCAGTGGKTRTTMEKREGRVVKEVKHGEGRQSIEETMDVPTDELYRQEQETDAAMAASVENAQVYRIGAGDVLNLHSLNDPSLDGPAIVRYDGNISLPQVQDLKIVGLTREEATELVRKEYGKIFGDPQMSLVVESVNSRSFTVMGNVASPGQYPYTRSLTLIDAIMAAGGLRVFTPGGDVFVSSQGQLVAAFIIRHIDGERVVKEYDLRNISDPGSHVGDTPVLPGDLVYVPDSVNLIYVIGEVDRPSVIPMTAGMTLLQLFAYTGGFIEETGRIRNVILLREVDPETTRISLINVRQIFKTGGDVWLQPGDIIYVPQRRLYRLATFVEQLTGSIDPVLTMYRNYWEAYYAQDRLRSTIKLYETYRQIRNDVTVVPGITLNPIMPPAP
ncbi:MAG: hypothetical protein GWP08_01520 [Nitrospiraceae bacterium]|nr:hypothetical protein [Nitrospiraceae bacterium]